MKKAIEDIVDHRVVTIRGGGCQKYLVNCRGECTWIMDEELQKLDHDLYDRFHAFNSLESSLLKPRRDNGGCCQQPLKTHKRHPKADSNAQALLWNVFNDVASSWDLA